MSRNKVGWMILLAGLSFAGCLMEARPDPSRFFALTSLPRAGSSAKEDSSPSNTPFLGIGPIKIPGYLDREQVVTRVSQNRLAIAESDRWAEPLEENFSRVLSENLSILLQTDRIAIYPWERSQRPTYQVQLDVLRFEPKQEGAVELWARWAILDDARKILISKESHLTQPAKNKSTEASVAAMSESVAELSREMAVALRNIASSKRM
ncbi:MAG TPA: PqiC family protein [Candidatus Binatia bacterium]|jgi:hypothetical protein